MEMKVLSLKDFDHTLNQDLITKAKSFQDFMDQMDRHKHNAYFLESTTNTGSNMELKIPYGGGIKEVVGFISNDYLGLSRHPETIEAGIEALRLYGTGSCAAPIIGGYMKVHRDLELELAEFLGQEDCVIFSSGFGANEGALTAMLGKNDIALIDSFIHSSSLNGLYGTNVKNIGHNDPEYLERVLINVKDKYATKLVIIDGVYSQNGDISCLPEIAAVCKKHGAVLMVDDAHGVGVFGKNGKGVVEHFGMLGQVDIITGTLSKAFGCVGGFVAASSDVTRYVRHYAPQTVFSAAITPSVTASVLKALELMKREPQLRTKLWDNVGFMRREMTRIGIDVSESVSPIFPVRISGDERVKNVAAMLLEKGFYAIGIGYPAVRKKDARIRVSVLATHTEEEIVSFANALKDILK